MSLDSAWNMYIFRDGKSVHRGTNLVREMQSRLDRFAHVVPTERRAELIDLLLRAGELECALRDAESPHSATAESLTNAMADALVRGAEVKTEALLRALSAIMPPGEVRLGPPEGFAYYALHPLDFADLARNTAGPSGYSAIIGVRSIGTTLSAIVRAALFGSGRCAERITVRPEGHPYDRRTEFSPKQLDWIAAMHSRHAEFLVVDEGPGMSGSSFLSVGDALVELGVPRSSIRFLGSRFADPDSLNARNAGERWRSFDFHSTAVSHYLPPAVKEYLGGGIWRGKAFNAESEWPASWTQMERMKFLSADGDHLYKFEGLGRFGQAVNERAGSIADGGFGPQPLRREEGFGIYPFVRGRYLSSANVSEEMLLRIADYCAWRAKHMQAEVNSVTDLQTMLSFNVSEEFGVELPGSVRLELERPVIADARMLPHKWIDTREQILKVDAAIHGDDHFFPGPTDVAWDLAGAIVEWKLESDAAEVVLRRYRANSGEDASSRLPAYLLAYSVFRMGYCKMAAAAMRGTFEYDRLQGAYQRYREQAGNFVEQLRVSPIRCTVAG